MDKAERMPEQVTSWYTLTGPGSGVVNVPSTSFTVALTSVSALTDTLAITPNSGGAGGTFFPVTVNLTIASPSTTFSYTPVSTGTKTISTTNNGGVINPRSLTYTVTP